MSIPQEKGGLEEQRQQALHKFVAHVTHGFCGSFRMEIEAADLEAAKAAVIEVTSMYCHDFKFTVHPL